jgi:uncharacterized protein
LPALGIGVTVPLNDVPLNGVLTASRTSTRLTGIDAARALAFGGMLLAHFAFSRPQSDDPGWLQALDNTADGRAAPLFCLLLGVGAGLLAARGTSDGAFVRRGLVLFGLGLAVWPLVDRVYLILPHYGILLALFPLVRLIPTRWLLPAAGVAFLIPSALVATFGQMGLRAGGQPSTYGELLDLPAVLGTILWTGGYPIVGWAGFVLVGAWVVRLRLRAAGTQWALLVGSVALAATQPLAAGGAGFLDATAHSNQTAWYVLASATAVAVLAACLLAAGGLRLLVPLGQMALTAYLAHLLLGEALVFPWFDAGRPALAVQMAVAAAVFVAFAAGARAWLACHRRGPLETAVRALAR